jgi:hypothetical protein
MWPGLVGKGPGSEPFIDLDTMLNLTTGAKSGDVRFEGVDLFLADPHISIDSTDDDLKRLADKLVRTSFPIMLRSASSGFRTGRHQHSFLPGRVLIWTQAKSDGPSTVYPGILASGDPQLVTDRDCMTSVTALPWRRCSGGIAAGRTSDGVYRFCRPISVIAT